MGEWRVVGVVCVLSDDDLAVGEWKDVGVMFPRRWWQVV